MTPQIIKSDKYIEVIGHYDDKVLCAKMTLLADLYAIEHKVGYAKFKIEDEDKLNFIDEKLKFAPSEPGYIFSADGLTILYEMRGADMHYYDDGTGSRGVRGLYLGGPDGSLEFDLSGYSGLSLTIEGTPLSSETFQGDGATFYVLESSTTKSIDCSTLSGWSSLSSGTHSITLKASASGYRDSELSTAVSVTKSASMPVKGQLITMNLDGTDRQYRVLSVNGTQVEVLSIYTPNNSCYFNSSGTNIYTSGELDNYLENTWYAGLTTTAKEAIVAKTFNQDSWYWGTSGSPSYSGYYGSTNPGTSSYSVSLGSTTYGGSITRHAYALSVQDVIDYVTDTSVGDGQLQNYNIWKMFWNDTVSHSEYPWFRSARAGLPDSDAAWGVNGYNGRVSDDVVIDSLAVRPAFTIDLSKWTSWS